MYRTQKTSVIGYNSVDCDALWPKSLFVIQLKDYYNCFSPQRAAYCNLIPLV